jgi:hypothetical protein
LGAEEPCGDQDQKREERKNTFVSFWKKNENGQNGPCPGPDQIEEVKGVDQTRGSGYGEGKDDPGKKEGKTQDDIIKEDDEDLRVIPGQLDEIEANGIADEITRQDRKGIEESID